MGIVYKARDDLLSIWVAIKILIQKDASENQIVRFQKEAQLASKLRHHGLITILDFGAGDGGQLYLVMELVEGRCLSEIIDEDGPMEGERAAEIFSQLCSAMAHVHSNAIVHRDLKPSNVMLTPDGMVKILDFGIAKYEDDQQLLTARGIPVGTPEYMSPEQFEGAESDLRSDIYSMGCLMFRTLTGSPPFLGESIVELVEKHKYHEPPSLASALGHPVPQDLEALVSRCLSKDPDHRFQSMIELEDAISSLDFNSTYEEESQRSQSRSLKKWKNFATIALAFMISLMIPLASVLLLFQFGSKGSLRQRIDELAHSADLQELKTLRDRLSPHLRKEEKDGKTYFSPREIDPFKTEVMVTDETIQQLSSLRQTRDVDFNLPYTEVTGSGFKSLSSWPIRKVDLESSPVDDKGLLVISKLKSLKKLVIPDTKITDDGLIAAAPNLQNLESCSVSFCKNISNRGILVLVTRCKKLDNLTISDTKATGEIMVAIARMKHLGELRINGLDLQDKDMESLRNLETLSRLEFANNPRLTDACLDFIRTKRKIGITLDGCPKITEDAKDRLMRRLPEGSSYKRLKQADLSGLRD